MASLDDFVTIDKGAVEDLLEMVGHETTLVWLYLASEADSLGLATVQAGYMATFFEVDQGVIERRLGLLQRVGFIEAQIDPGTYFVHGVLLPTNTAPGALQ